MQTEVYVGCSWSGGKDSCYALMQAVKQGAVPKILVNMMNETGNISRSHGLPLSLLQQQASAMQLPLKAISTSWKEYEGNFVDTLNAIKSNYDIGAMVFGDIDLQAHRDWEEMVCVKAGIKAMLPIWQRDRKELLMEMLATGMHSMIVSCNDVLGKEFLGRILDYQLIPELEARGVDVCGENGEFHTIVTNCTMFSQAIVLPLFAKIRHQDYHFLEWLNS